MAEPLGAGLADRAVMVTGAAGSIGREVALAFARAGSRVALVDLPGTALQPLLGQLEGSGHTAIAADLRDATTHAALVARVEREVGPLRALAHVAAVLRRAATVDAVTVEDWDLQHEVNLRAAFFLNRAVADALRRGGTGGAIVNFSSQGWWTGGFGGSVVYAASKGGIVSMSRGLARTYGPDAVTVNVVSPGGVDTPMFHDGMRPDALAAFVNQIPLGRLAQPAELAGTVVFLASDHARYITGATVNVSGGQLMY